MFPYYDNDEVHYFVVNMVWLTKDGMLEERVVKKTTSRRVAEAFMKITKELKPEVKLYMSMELME